MKAPRFLAILAMVSVLLFGLPHVAWADYIASRCDTRWQNDGSEGLNWCAFVGYNATTGTIQAGMSYSDFQTGNVYAIRAIDVLLWRQTPDGAISLKDSCEGCPVTRFVYNDADQVTTGWSGFGCSRDYWAEIDFRIQWEPDGDLTGLIVRNSPSVSLC